MSRRGTPRTHPLPRALDPIIQLLRTGCAAPSAWAIPVTYQEQLHHELRLGCLEDTGDRFVEDGVELLVGLLNQKSLGERP